MFELIASWVTRRGWLVLAGWVAIAALIWAVAPPWSAVSKDDDVRFFPKDSPSVIGQDLLERGFPQDATSSDAAIITERRSGKLTTADFAFIDQMVTKLRDLARAGKEAGSPDDLSIDKITDYHTPIIGPRLIGKAHDGPGQAVLTIISLKATYLSKQARLTVNRLLEEFETLKAQAPEGLTLAITGSAVVGRDTNQASLASINSTTWATVILVIAILLVVYRSPLLALIPLLTIALSVWISLQGIPLLTLIPTLNFQVINVTRVFVVVVLFGAGTDYCLFLIARYREELARGRDRIEALHEAIVQVGGALLASAGTVIVGLGMLYFSTFAKIQYTGPAIALSLAVSLAAALTLAPVLLTWLRGKVFWPFKPPHHHQGADPDAEGQGETLMAGFWAGVADRVVRRPLAILLVSLLALAPLAVVGAQTRSNYSQLTDLGPEQPSIIGAHVIRRYFAVGELSPTTVLIRHPEIDFRSAEGRRAVAELSRRLVELPEVDEVRSLARPLGKPVRSLARNATGQPDGASPPAEPKPAAGPNLLGQFFRGATDNRQNLLNQLREQALRIATDRRYISTDADEADRNHITRLDVVFTTDPFSEESLENLERVRQVVSQAVAPGGPLAGDARFGLAGATPQIEDLKRVVTHDEHWMYVRVTLGVYLILVLLLRRPGICLYLIATVVFSYLATLGLTELVFRSLHTGPEAWVGLDWKVGFFLFVILVAVGEDYNIFLMSRVLEEERKYGSVEGTRRATANTGGIISSCGLIMAGTFGSMLTASLMSLKELGFALGLGVLLDTFIVRPILVPAFVVLLHRGRSQTPATESSGPLDPAEAGATSAP